jgi:hypothetical protein
MNAARRISSMDCSVITNRRLAINGVAVNHSDPLTGVRL